MITAPSITFARNFYDNLPEHLKDILQYLPPTDQLELRRVNKLWAQLLGKPTEVPVDKNKIAFLLLFTETQRSAEYDRRIDSYSGRRYSLVDPGKGQNLTTEERNKMWLEPIPHVTAMIKTLACLPIQAQRLIAGQKEGTRQYNFDQAAARILRGYAELGIPLYMTAGKLPDCMKLVAMMQSWVGKTLKDESVQAPTGQKPNTHRNFLNLLTDPKCMLIENLLEATQHTKRTDTLKTPEAFGLFHGALNGAIVRSVYRAASELGVQAEVISACTQRMMQNLAIQAHEASLNSPYFGYEWFLAPPGGTPESQTSFLIGKTQFLLAFEAVLTAGIDPLPTFFSSPA